MYTYFDVFACTTNKKYFSILTDIFFIFKNVDVMPLGLHVLLKLVRQLRLCLVDKLLSCIETLHNNKRFISKTTFCSGY